MNYFYIWLSLTLIWVFWQIISSPFTRLHRLVLNGDIDKIKTYLDHKNNPDINKNNGLTSLYTAICDGNLAVVKLLISYGANVNWGLDNQKNMDYLLTAIDHNHFEIVDFLIASNARKGIHYSSFIGDVSQINQLISVDSDAICLTRNEGKIALHYAVLGKHKSSIQLLIQSGANINHFSTTDRTPVHLAIENSLVDILEYLLSYNLNQDNIDIGLNYAVRKNNLEMVKMLLTRKANVNYSSRSTDPALYLAVDSRNISIASVILESGADVNQKVFVSGNRAIHAAVFNNDIAMTELLIQHGADLDAMNNLGSTPLGLVHGYIGYEELEKILIEHNASNYGPND
jgi:ankyrin repeat protein